MLHLCVRVCLRAIDSLWCSKALINSSLVSLVLKCLSIAFSNYFYPIRFFASIFSLLVFFSFFTSFSKSRSELLFVFCFVFALFLSIIGVLPIYFLPSCSQMLRSQCTPDANSVQQLSFSLLLLLLLCDCSF